MLNEKEKWRNHTTTIQLDDIVCVDGNALRGGHFYAALLVKTIQYLNIFNRHADSSVTMRIKKSVKFAEKRAKNIGKNLYGKYE